MACSQCCQLWWHWSPSQVPWWPLLRSGITCHVSRVSVHEVAKYLETNCIQSIKTVTGTLCWPSVSIWCQISLINGSVVSCWGKKFKQWSVLLFCVVKHPNKWNKTFTKREISFTIILSSRSLFGTPSLYDFSLTG